MALDINDLGQVVGEADDGLLPPASIRVALLWSEGEVYDLNELIPPDSGWQLETAVAINRRGQIVGRGLHDGVRRAYLLNPPGGGGGIEIPTLGATATALLVLLLAAAGAMLLARRGAPGGPPPPSPGHPA